MAYVVTPEDIQKVRYEVQDVSVDLPVLSDDVYTYILEKYDGSISFSALDAARMILFRLSYNVDEVVDILSIKGSKAAENWRYALEMFIKNPMINPVYRTFNPYAGGISKEDIATNLADADQNTVTIPYENKQDYTVYDPKNPFMI